MTVSPSTAPAPTVPPSDSHTTWWPWLLLLLAALGGIFWLVARSSRRRDWDTRLGLAIDQARWVAESFAPNLADRAVPTAGASQYWFEGRPRLDELQAELVALAATAPNEIRANALTRASVSLTALSQALETDVALRGVTATPENVAALEQSYRLIEQRREALLMDIADSTPSTPN